MAKTHDENFSQLLEKAKTIAQQGKKTDAIRSVLKHMNLSSDENNPDLYAFISDIPLAEMLGIPNRTDVWNVRDRLRKKRSGTRLSTTKVENKVDSSGTEHIGEGDEFVYLYYFRTYKKYAESKDLNYWQCNIGLTKDSPEDRVASQIGGQLPEKATLSLVMQTNDCETLEKLIHCELKRREQWLNPEAGADVIGEEWFSTNPAEVKDIFMEYVRYQQAKKFCDEFKKPSSEAVEKMDDTKLKEFIDQYREYMSNSDIVKEYEGKN